MKAKNKKISKKMTFAEVMKANPEAGLKLAERGMFCSGCPMAMMETLEQGCLAHGIDADEILKELNEK
jgi:hydroxylamine reductase